jgi:ribosomal-protein-alanine N-acetyltransferase
VLYGVSPPEWGRGFATEIAPTALRHGFERAGLTRAIGVGDADNVAPRRVLEKVGLRGARRRRRPGRGPVRDPPRRFAGRFADYAGMRA